MADLVGCINAASKALSKSDRTYLVSRAGTLPDEQVISDRIEELRAELEALETGDVSSSSPDLERSGETGQASEPLGAEAIPDASGPDGQIDVDPGGSIDTAGPLDGRDTGLSESAAVTDGAPSNNKVFGKDGQPEASERAARDNNIAGSNTAVEQGAPIDPAGVERTEEADTRGALAKQREGDKTKVKLGDRKNIGKSLPNLMPEQADDVAKAEARFFTGENTGEGFLLTNGTGTGKTFSGLGVIKRFVQQGKTNILVVTPNDTISSEWQNTAQKFFDLPVSKLAGVADAGSGPVITQYANFYQNMELYKRDWDLVVYDESHKLKGGQGRNDSKYTEQHLALTRHPSWLNRAAHNILINEYNAIEAKRDAYADTLEGELPDPVDRKRAADEHFSEEMTQHFEAERLVAEDLKNKPRPKVQFLSATPFASEQSIDYAEGYLFEYEAKDGNEGYNSGSGRDQYFMSNFGYRMRYNKLTQPESAVDSGLLQQEFHERIKESGALSGRALEMDADYSRDFVLPATRSKLGTEIDEGMDYIRGWERDADGQLSSIQDDNHKYKDLANLVKKSWDYHYMNTLLEGLNTQDAVERTREHLKLGRKVVVFHRYKQRQPQHPFQMLREHEGQPGIKRELAQLKKNRPDLWNMDMGDLVHPFDAFKEAFGDQVAFHNGDVKIADRKANLRNFNDDNGTLKVKVVQIQAGKEGVSWHDTTGKNPRALISIGLPIQSTDTTQMEGRTYRMGNESDAMFEYIKQGLAFEERAFATAIATRSSAVENMAMGNEARNLMDAFIDGYQDAEAIAPNTKQGKGGKKGDRQRNDMSAWDKAKTHYFKRGKRNAKNKAREGVDYFATPEPIGLKMVEWAGIKPNEKVLEPSAGHGAIARFIPPSAAATVIEPSPELEGQLILNAPNATHRDGDFESLYIGNKYDAIVMNPPFGRAGSVALPHIKKAAGHLSNGGRIVAVYPEGAAMEKLTKWLESDDAAGIYPVTMIDMPSAMFERAGTKVRTKIVVLDKHANPSDVPASSRKDLSSADSINELFERMEGLTVPPRSEPTVPDKPAFTPGVRVPSRPGKSKAESKVLMASVYEHSKTGEKYALLKPQQHLGAHFKQAKKIAKKHGGYWSRYAKGFLFPEGADSEAAAAAVEGAIGWQLQVKVKGAGTGTPINQARAQRLVDQQTKDWTNGPKIHVINNELELPLSLQAQISAQDLGKIGGVRQGDRVFLLAANHYTDNSLLTALAHESVGHYAMEQLPDFQDAIDIVLENSANDPVIERLTAKVHNLYPGSQNDPHLMAREVIAFLAERNKSHGMLTRLRGAVRRALKALGFKVRPSSVELDAMVRRAARSLAEPAGWSDPTVRADFRVEEETPESFDYVPGVETWREKTDRLAFDRFQPLKKVQAEIAKAGRNVTDLEDAFAAEQQMSGKIELEFEKFERDLYDPLKEFMSANEISQPELDIFLYARHAPERNAQIAKINPEMPDGGSGMSTEEAVQVLQKAQAEGKLEVMNEAAAMVNKITAFTRQRMVDGGLESQDTIDHWTGAKDDPDAIQYENYVPLRGFSEPKPGMESGPLSGRGGSLGVRGKESMRALGRRSLAESPLANTLEQAQRTIMRAGKAEVGRHLLRLADSHPNGDLWKIWSPGKTPMKRIFNKATKEVSYVPATGEFQNPRFFPVKAEGQQYYIEIFDERLANAMQNLGPTDMNAFLRMAAKVTRYLSMINTQLNPDFIPVNFVRDIQSAMAHAVIDSRTKGSKLEGKRVALQVARDVMPAMRGIYNGFKDMDDPGYWASMYKEFREQGAKVGFFGQINLKQDALDIDKDLKRSAPVKAAKAALKYLDRVNTAVENAARLSLYVNSVRKGVSRKQAAVMAKNLTVNFNRHGEIGPAFNAVYMFVNAAAQGSSAILTRFVKSRTSQVLATTLAASTYAMTEYLRAIMDDDDDGRSKYEDIPDYIRERNFVIPDFSGVTEDGYWTIPMPYGYNFFAVMGMAASDAQHGRHASDVGNMVAGSFIAAFNPLGLEVSDEVSGTIGKMLTPSAIKPMVDVWVNENWFGAPVMPDNPYSNGPDSRKFYSSNPETYRNIATFMNDVIGGGSEYRPASPEVLDISPETMQQVFEFYTGGVGRTVERSVSLIDAVASGEEIDPSRDIPIVRRFLSERDGRNDSSQFYDRKTEIERIGTELKKTKDFEAKREFRKRFGPQIKLIDDMKRAKKKLGRIRKLRKRAQAEGNDEKVQGFYDQEAVIHDEFNLKYNETVN